MKRVAHLLALAALWCLCTAHAAARPDTDEVVMADEMWQQGTLPQAEEYLRQRGYRLKFHHDIIGEVIYSKVGGGEGTVFRIKPMTRSDPQIRLIMFSTTTPPERLTDSLSERGFECTEVGENTVGFLRGDLTVTLSIDWVVPSCIVTFIRQGGRFAF